MPPSGMHKAVGRGRGRVVDCRFNQLKSPFEKFNWFNTEINIYLLGKLSNFELDRGKLSRR